MFDTSFTTNGGSIARSLLRHTRQGLCCPCTLGLDLPLVRVAARHRTGRRRSPRDRAILFGIGGRASGLERSADRIFAGGANSEGRTALHKRKSKALTPQLWMFHVTPLLTSKSNAAGSPTRVHETRSDECKGLQAILEWRSRSESDASRTFDQPADARLIKDLCQTYWDGEADR